MIKNATLIDEHTSTDHVQIGSTVKVKGEDGAETFTIVGSAEAKPAAGRISNESPGRPRPAGPQEGRARSASRSPPATSRTRSSRSARHGTPRPRRSATRGSSDRGLGRRAGGERRRPAGRQRLQDAVGDRPRRQPPRPGHPRRHHARPARRAASPTTLLYGVDDMDPMDAQALLSPDAIEREMGRPLAHIPDQVGDCHASLRPPPRPDVHRPLRRPRHPPRPLLLDERHLPDRGRWTRSSAPRSTARRSCARSTAGSRTSSTPTTGCRSASSARTAARSARRSPSDWDGETVAVECQPRPRGLGASAAAGPGRVSPFGGAAKLPWNLEWAAQWSLFGVTIEPNGKDLATAGGSRDRSNAIAREVFEREPPLNFPYEFLNIAGQKMSTSKGLGAAAHTIAEVVPPEQTAVPVRPASGRRARSSSTPRAPTRSRACSTSSTGSAPRPPAARSRASCRRATTRSSATRCSTRRRTSTQAAGAFRPAFAHLALLVQVPGVDVHGAGRRRRRGAPLTDAEAAELEVRLARRPALARGVRPRARPDRDPARRAAGRGRASSAPSSAASCAPWPRRPTATRPATRRAVAGGDLRRRRGPRPRRQGRVQRALPRVPRPAQRAACRLAAGQPRPRLRRSAGSGGRRSWGGDGMSVGVQRLREEPDRIRQGAIDKREDPAVVDRAIEVDATRRRLQAESDTLKAERNTASQADRRGDPRRRDARTAPRSPSCARRPPAPASGSTAIDAELAAAEAELDDLLLRIPNPADPDVPVGGEEANVTVRTWGEPARARGAGRRRRRLDAAAALGARRGARHHRQRPRRQDRGLGLPRLQGRGLAAPAQR